MPPSALFRVKEARFFLTTRKNKTGFTNQKRYIIEIEPQSYLLFNLE
jgi:hypothetical protein